jgi:hypothetical protein
VVCLNEFRVFDRYDISAPARTIEKTALPHGFHMLVDRHVPLPARDLGTAFGAGVHAASFLLWLMFSGL